ncbi:MAG: FAD-binding oxidoreductase [bacterium]
MTDPNASHEQKVAKIAESLRALAAHGEHAHIEKGGVHHFVPLPKDPRFAGRAVDASSLDQVLAIDRERRVCVAEPGVTFATLARATLAHGLLPTVVPELEGITIGGAIAGCSVESMSYRYGGFHDSCSEYEVVTGTGDVVRCSRSERALAFEMIHGSYGTLGVLAKATFGLVPAKPFVHMRYVRHTSFAAFERELRERCAAGEDDFIDAIIHRPDALVLCLGRFEDSAPYTSSYRRLEIFYKSTLARTEDHLATLDYCFRYDTECHWLTATFPPLEWKPVRFLLGKWLLGSTNLIRASGTLAPLLALKRRPDVVCDVFIPARRFGEFWEWYARDFDFFPLWIVPYRVPAMYPWISPAHAARMHDELFIDCAIYGKPNADPRVDWSERLEEKTYELGGIKTLISRNHYDQERFWSIYHRENYDAIKREHDPRGVFPGLYEKLHRVG